MARHGNMKTYGTRKMGGAKKGNGGHVVGKTPVLTGSAPVKRPEKT